MTQRQIRIISWNVNGIRAAERKGFLAWLQASGADIVAVQETKAHPDQLSPTLREPPGYHVDWCAAETKGYSGVATFSRVAPINVTCGLGDPRFDTEGRVLISPLMSSCSSTSISRTVGADRSGSHTSWRSMSALWMWCGRPWMRATTWWSREM